MHIFAQTWIYFDCSFIRLAEIILEALFTFLYDAAKRKVTHIHLPLCKLQSKAVNLLYSEENSLFIHTVLLLSNSTPYTFFYFNLFSCFSFLFSLLNLAFIVVSFFGSLYLHEVQALPKPLKHPYTTLFMIKLLLTIKYFIRKKIKIFLPPFSSPPRFSTSPLGCFLHQTVSSLIVSSGREAQRVAMPPFLWLTPHWAIMGPTHAPSETPLMSTGPQPHKLCSLSHQRVRCYIYTNRQHNKTRSISSHSCLHLHI